MCVEQHYHDQCIYVEDCSFGDFYSWWHPHLHMRDIYPRLHTRVISACDGHFCTRAKLHVYSSPTRSKNLPKTSMNHTVALRFHSHVRYIGRALDLSSEIFSPCKCEEVVHNHYYTSQSIQKLIK